MFDLLISGGTVLDPASKRNGHFDVGITNGRVVSIERAIPKRSAKEILDASGCYVTPGFVDMHAHVYWGVNPIAIDPDPYCAANGVTTVVDCGTAGSYTFPGLRRYVIERCRTRVLAFVHVGRYGIQADPGEFGHHTETADPEGAARTVRENADVTLGIKVRMGRMMVGDHNGPAILDAALRAAELAQTRLIVHVGDTPISIEAICDRLRPGDIVTHCLHPMPERIVDDKGKIKPAVRRARERGVCFDLAHARGMLGFAVARAALADGFGPDTLSSDAHTKKKADPGLDLPTILSKFLAFGWDLEQAIAACTIRPAQIMGWDDRVGTLAVGREADVTVFKVYDGAVSFRDIAGDTLEGKQRVAPMWTIRAGVPAPARDNPGFRDQLAAYAYLPAELMEPEAPECCG